MKGEFNVEKFDNLLSMLDHILNSKKKRHLAGGILVSVSLLFGGLAVTVLILKSEEKGNELQVI